MGRGKALQGDRRAGDRDKQAKPPEPAPVGAVPTVPRYPVIGESKQQEECRTLDALRVCTRAKGKIDRDSERQGPDKNVNHCDLPIADLVQYPQSVEKKDSPNPKE